MTKSRPLSLFKKLVFIVFVLGCGETEQQGIINPKRNVINPQLADNKKTSKIKSPSKIVAIRTKTKPQIKKKS